MDPVTIAKIGLGGLGLARSLFGHKNSQLSNDPFSYTPDQSDPELLLRRRLALEQSRRDRMRTVDELSRSGLLGSSASFGVLGESQARGDRNLEDINADVFGNRRQESLQLYRDKLAFERQLALMDKQQSGQENLLGLGSLGDIGESLFSMDNIDDGSLSSFLKNQKNLPSNLRRMLLEASNYQSPSYDIRRAAL